jgi:DNA replication protein DnaC
MLSCTLLDDLGPDRLNAGQRHDLMEIVEDRHGRSSTLIASQLPVKTWHDLIGDPTFADAILDRLVHNAYRLELEGPRSMRETDPDAEVHAASAATPVVSNGKSAKGGRK